MAAALSLDLRERVIAAIEAGASCRQAAERFGIGAASAIRWYARFREEGEIAAKAGRAAGRSAAVGAAGGGPAFASGGGSCCPDPAEL